MKITANRKEDILRRKAEYEADVEKRKSEYDAQEQKYYEAEEAVFAPVRSELEDMLKKYPRLESEVRVETAPFRRNGLRVCIRVNDRDVHDKKKALSWNYDAYLGDEGEVVRETGSWSGLQAVTDEQLEQLEQSLQALKELKDLDWNGLLNRSLPNFRDYITVDDPRYDRNKPDFDKELREAEIEDIIGQRKMILVKQFPGSWYWKDHYVAITRDSGSQYTIVECPMGEYEAGNASKFFDAGQSHRVKKEQIVPVQPINIIDV